MLFFGQQSGVQVCARALSLVQVCERVNIHALTLGLRRTHARHIQDVLVLGWDSQGHRELHTLRIENAPIIPGDFLQCF